MATSPIFLPSDSNLHASRRRVSNSAALPFGLIHYSTHVHHALFIDYARLNNADHNFRNIVSPSSENLKNHPEWFALDENGERKGQLCTTNPEVIDITVSKAVAYFKTHPGRTTFSLAPDDGTAAAMCHCPRCKALDVELGIADGSITDRLLVYSNEAAKRLKELDPKYAEKRLGFLAYQNYTRAPHTVKADDMVMVLICFMSWDFCYDHPLNYPLCTANRPFMRWVSEWTRSARHVGIYYYTGLNEYSFPYPIWDVLPNHIRTFKQLGVGAVLHEAQQHWASQAPLYYLAARLAWDVNLDLDAFWKDYYQRMYGPAAEPMRKYWGRWIRAMDESGVCGGHAWGPRVCTPEVVGNCRAYLSEAYRAIERPPEQADYWTRVTYLDKVRCRLDFTGVSLKYADLWAQMKEAAGARDWDRALALADENIEHVKSSVRTWVPQPFVDWTTVRKLLEQEKIILEAQLADTTDTKAREAVQGRIDEVWDKDIENGVRL